MAVIMLALGSRGDVQPMAALAGELRRRGHDARVACLAEYADVAAEISGGAGVVPLPGTLAEAVRRGPALEALTRSPLAQVVLLRRWLARLAPGVGTELLAATRGGDALVTGLLGRGAAAALAEARGLRAATVVYTGQLPTLARESFFYPEYFRGRRRYDEWGTELSWRIATDIGAPLTAEVRRRLGLPRLGSRGVCRAADRHPILMATDPALVPPAADWERRGRRVVQTGYLAPPPESVEPGPELAAFLERRPVYVGFGSFTTFATRADLDLVVEAAGRAGVPVLTPAGGPVAPGPVGEDVLAGGPLPHSWLFGRVAATIHHAGSGTAHEALRSGRPSLGVPFGVDQPYHAARLHALGVGPPPLPRAGLTARRLARALRELTASRRADGDARREAQVGRECRSRDGVAAAADALADLGVAAPA